MQTYDIAAGWKDLSAGEQERVINLASIGELEKWANDPYCNQRSFVGTRLEWAQKDYTPPKPCGCSPDQKQPRLFSTIITPSGTIGGKFAREESAGFQ
jgi:hypothetical protein